MPVDPKEYTYLWKERIVSHPEILGGKPIIKGTRLSVEFVMGMMRRPGGTTEFMLENFQHITREDLVACQEYAKTGAEFSLGGWEKLQKWMDEEERLAEKRWRDLGYPLWEENASAY